MATSDGHTGTGHVLLNRIASSQFALVLARLNQAKGDTFVIHVAPQYQIIESHNFLQWAGFQRFEAPCTFHNPRFCFWRELAFTKAGTYSSDEKSVLINNAFEGFSRQIDHLYGAWETFDTILYPLRQEANPLPIFGNSVDISANAEDLPGWVDEVKAHDLRRLESEKKGLETQISDWQKLLRLVTATDEALVDSVVFALECLNLRAEKTERAATIDVKASSNDMKFRFGIEVTGLNEAIKKRSNKLTQVLQFEQDKDDAEKTILLANTYNQRRVSERTGENFTDDAARFLAPHPVLMMTGYDLYRLIVDVRSGTKKREDVVAMLYTTNGVLQYL